MSRDGTEDKCTMAPWARREQKKGCSEANGRDGVLSSGGHVLEEKTLTSGELGTSGDSFCMIPDTFLQT